VNGVLELNARDHPAAGTFAVLHLRRRGFDCGLRPTGFDRAVDILLLTLQLLTLDAVALVRGIIEIGRSQGTRRKRRYKHQGNNEDKRICAQKPEHFKNYLYLIGAEAVAVSVISKKSSIKNSKYF
jgi:hypothetical protein